MKKIGFIGAGNLGQPIAANLIKAGYAVTVYNRTKEKTSALAALGANIAPSAAETATPGGIVISLVSDDAALRHVADDKLASRLGKGGIHISMSTIGSDTSRSLSAHHASFGTSYVAAPVFARPEAAATKSGVVCISGANAEVRQRCHDIMADAVAKEVFDYGDDAGAANIVKLIGNFMIASTVEMLGEAFAMASENGLDAGVVHEMFASTLFASPVFRNYGRIIREKKFSPASFRLALGLKDINLVLQDAKTGMPLAEVVKGKLEKCVEKGMGELDWAAFAGD